MIKIKTIFIISSLSVALFFLDRLGVFQNPLLGTGVIILILLGVPIAWQIREYIKKKYPKMGLFTKCHFCGFEILEDATHCHNCGKEIEDIFAEEDKFAEDIKEKQFCPYCGLKELETIYEVSRGYKEVCASCGKSRVSRKALKFALAVIGFFVATALFFYLLIYLNLK
jgi:DNA-directed RNA polymerase subunit RPC12/RpoP